jgi:hypothetical protein
MDQDSFDLTHVLDEHGYCMGCDRKNPDPNQWIDERFSTCEEIALEGEPGIILKDNKGA